MGAIDDLLSSGPPFLPTPRFEKNTYEVVPTYHSEKILVVGACGSIGSALMQALKSANVTGMDWDEYGVVKMRSLGFNMILRPAGIPAPEGYDIVIHCAAYKHVVLGEEFEEAFWYNNVGAVQEFLKGFQKTRPKLIYVSTDKASGTSVMGRTKEKAESIVTNWGGVSLRLVNVFNSKGSVWDQWSRSLTQNYRPIVVPEAYRFFMRMEDAVAAILSISPTPPEYALNPGVYTVYGFPEIRIGDLWKEFVCLHGPRFHEERDLFPGEVARETLFHPEGEELRDLARGWLWQVLKK